MIQSHVPLPELLLCIALLALVVVALRRLGFERSRVLLGLCALAAAVGLGVTLGPRGSAAGSTPIRLAKDHGYASSGACRSCHPAQYQSWHQSYHRSMTEPANGDTVRAPWQGAIGWRGRSYTLSRRGDEFWATLPDPDRAAALARQGAGPDAAGDVERRVVMTTGSHHYQGYWVEGARGNELWQLPIVYHFESQRFIARHDAFLHPDDDPPYFARWNSNCIQCHSVAGEPRHDLRSDRFDSRVVELGIACEACHGPGAAHAARERDPLVRLRQRGSDGADGGARDIVNPRRLDAERASEICGQCHSYFVPRDPDGWWTSGFSKRYRPGDDLDASRRLLEYRPGSPEQDPELDAHLESVFYPDGTVRVGGREWNGLRESACFTRGRGDHQLACTTCHRMHDGSRDDQLILVPNRAVPPWPGPPRPSPAQREPAEPGTNGHEARQARDDVLCKGCHTDYGVAHSRHPEGSSGNECLACHMPRTTYALFKAIRSHRISKPSLDPTTGAALNACNLCHQNRSLEWTSARLADWSPAAARTVRLPAATSDASASWSALAVAALSGDAAARVIAAHELGDAAARSVSGRGWQAQLLVEMLDDPYAAVRFVAQRSLRTFPGFADFAFDFDAPHALRVEQQAEGRRRAAANASPGERQAEPLPLDERGVIPRAIIERLIGARDQRPIRIAE
jgi:hypothetical protein